MGMSQELPPDEDKRAFVRAMFDRIAPRYDLLNRLISLGFDQRWRRCALDAIELGSGDRVIDLATGTGDLAQLARQRGASVIGLDLVARMLRHARIKSAGTHWVQGDAARLPFADASADVVTCGFALRNFVDLDEVFWECARVLVRGGRFVALELDQPRSRALRWGQRLHCGQVVPRLGALLSDNQAYRYLPNSTAYLPQESVLCRKLEASGFVRVAKQVHMLGAVQRITAVKGS